MVLDRGEPRRIVEFRSDTSAPLSVAFLVDVSGSMQVGMNTEGARRMARQLLAWLVPGRDEAALYTFDTRLVQVHGFTREIARLSAALDDIRPFGATSLFDAIAETARHVADRASGRLALIVLTDGVDTSSRLTAPEVSGIASAIDVPVYVVAVVSPVDHPGGASSVVPKNQGVGSGRLDDLTRWTGGDLFVVSVSEQGSAAARRLVEELRHQYLIAFEAAAETGWHPLEVRTRNDDLIVRSRSGYIAGGRGWGNY